MKNYEVFATDPRKRPLPNNGVAKIAEPETPDQWNVLKFELQSFVCEGQYEHGLNRILSSYLANAGESEQPAAWVSGFFGSGKSHLVKVLEYLWKNVEFSDGATAQGLVHLPDTITDLLTELTVLARREGGLWAAAGTVDVKKGESARLAMLAILYRGAGLPERADVAQFTLWLHKNGLYEPVKAGVEAAGKNFDAEIRQFHISPAVRQAMLKAYPQFANTPAEAGADMKAAFPLVSDLTVDELVAAVRELMAFRSNKDGKLPCTLLVLDELQQFIGDSADRTYDVQLAVEALSSRLDGKLLVVGTGQSAMQGTPQLAKLQGRFKVNVGLSDTDVEKVVRKVVLRKAANREADIRAVLDSCSGEIDRHLTGTQVGPKTEDRSVRVADYPLLPVRRRFWERVLRAVDRAGAAGQLRTQLRVVHEAARTVADKPLGTVVGGDFIYNDLSQPLLMSGVLLKDIYERIEKQREVKPDGALRARLCATIFLINQLPAEQGESGIRADAKTLADLLVEDLTKGSDDLRQKLPDVLNGLVEDSVLMQLGDQYRLQTQESAEWDADYRSRVNTILADPIRIPDERTIQLKAAVQKQLGKMQIPHGKSKIGRAIGTHYATDAPKANAADVVVWVRDEWQAPAKTVQQDAQAAGDKGSLIYVLLPQKEAEGLKTAVASAAAAKDTLDTRGIPSTPEGQNARASMETRLHSEQAKITRVITDILGAAKVYKGGGTEVPFIDLRATVESAANDVLARIYPNFPEADDPKWSTVVKRIREGASGSDALGNVGHATEVEKQTVCKKVMEHVGAAGKKGTEVRKHFTAPPFGWPQDAVDGALLALLSAGCIQASLNGAAVTVKQVDQANLTKVDFRTEGIIVTATQRIGVRGLLTDAGMAPKAGEEGPALPEYLQQLITLAEAAGGPAPLPAPPSTVKIQELRAQTGNAQIVAVYEAREQMKKNRKDWTALSQAAAKRLPRWQVLQQMLSHAAHLDGAAQIQPQVDGILSGRSLLNDPDPVPPLIATLSDALRQALVDAQKRYKDVYDRDVDGLITSGEWKKLEAKDRDRIRQEYSLDPAPQVKAGTEAQLLNTLEQTPLAWWGNATQALSYRVQQAWAEVHQCLQPKAVPVKLPKATLATEAEVDTYLESARLEILKHINAGNPVIL